MIEAYPDHAFAADFFADASPELRALYEKAAERAGLLYTHFCTIRDLLELSEYLDQEPLHALLLALVLALDEGSLCLDASEPALARRFAELVAVETARTWAGRAAASLEQHGFPALISAEAEEDKPIVLRRPCGRVFLYFQKYLKHESALLATLRQRLDAGQAARPGGNLRAILDEVLASRPLRIGGRAVQLNRDQRLALGVALLRKFVIISGGPGTGKTSIACTLLRCLVRSGIAPERIALAAPTGRAAQRLTDALRTGLASLGGPNEIAAVDASLQDVTAQTLHRLLDYQPARGTFRRHAENPIAADVILVDEVSMVGLVLMAQLFQAAAPDARLILLGDKDQLPSVEAGAILANLVPSDGRPRLSTNLHACLVDMFPDLSLSRAAGPHPLRDAFVILEENYRSERHIQDAASAVNRQDESLVDRLPRFLPARVRPAASGAEAASAEDGGAAHTFADLAAKGGCWLLEQGTVGPAAWRRVLEDWAEHCYLCAAPGTETYRGLVQRCQAPVLAELPAEERNLLDRFFAIFAHARILTLVRAGLWGCAGINHLLQHLLRPHFDAAGTGRLFAGAPVLITHTDSTRQLSNGDVGIVLRSRDGGYRAVFPRLGSYLSLPADALPPHELGFALTVHKSQGSEYGRVLLVLPPEGGGRLLTKELIYTGITRAKDLVVIYGKEETLRTAIRRKVDRSSALAALMEGMPPKA